MRSFSRLPRLPSRRQVPGKVCSATSQHGWRPCSSVLATADEDVEEAAMTQVHHSDVIGSLLRPKYLTNARDAYAAGQLTAPEFKRIEDHAVDAAIAMQ